MCCEKELRSDVVYVTAFSFSTSFFPILIFMTRRRERERETLDVLFNHDTMDTDTVFIDD